MLTQVKIAVIALVLGVFNTVATNAQPPPCIFDIVVKYGAKPDGVTDATQALLCAFKDACASPTPAKIVIPKGDFLIAGSALMKGPCKAPLTFQWDGCIKAAPGPPQIKDDWLTINYIDGLTICGTGSIDGQGPTFWGKVCKPGDLCKNVPFNLRLNFIKNSFVRGITIKDSKNFQTNVIGCENLVFENVKVIAPADSPNTDGIHIAKSKNITVIDSIIQTGDDCISIGDGMFGLHIERVTCGPGHGISIGSLGGTAGEEPVDGVHVKNCTFNCTDNGVRIKTWPDSKDGLVKNVIYEDVVMNNVKNPIVIDQVYCPWNKCNKAVPSKVKIANITFCNIRGTSSNVETVQLLCSGTFPCNQVMLRDIDLTSNAGPAQSICQNVKPAIVGKNNPPACASTAQPVEPKKL